MHTCSRCVRSDKQVEGNRLKGYHSTPGKCTVSLAMAPMRCGKFGTDPCTDRSPPVAYCHGVL